MHAANSWKSYRQIATQTAPPGQLILMLFDGALHSMERALAGFDFSDPGEKNQTIHNNLQRAVDIIRLLNNSLNLETGGKLAETLRRLYNYYDQRLVESNMKKRRDGVDEVLPYLKELRDAWETMLSRHGQESPSEIERGKPASGGHEDGMSAEKALFDAYREWRRLAQAAGKAIRLRNWNLLSECQELLQNFQPLITRLTCEARAEWKQSGMDCAAQEKNLRTIVSELIGLTRHNRSLIQTARTAAQPKREQLEQAGRNLKRLQQSYIFARPSAWTSFS